MQSSSNKRLDEYGPYPFHSEFAEESFSGHGLDTMHFFVDTLKPYIDANYRTKKKESIPGLLDQVVVV